MRWVTSKMALLFIFSCEQGEVESGVFFPAWSAEGARPSGVVQGVLVRTDGCLFVESDGRRTLPIWEEGLGFVDDALIGPDGEPIARVGELIHGGGGYYADRAHIEGLAGEPIPDRCMLDGTDRFALIYDVASGSFR